MKKKNVISSGEYKKLSQNILFSRKLIVMYCKWFLVSPNPSEALHINQGNMCDGLGEEIGTHPLSSWVIESVGL